MKDKDKIRKEGNNGLNDTCRGKKKREILRLGNKQG